MCPKRSIFRDHPDKSVQSGLVILITDIRSRVGAEHRPSLPEFSAPRLSGGDSWLTGERQSTIEGQTMNNAKLAVAVGAGYLLGRFHKGRWALALAGMAAGKRISTNPTALIGEALEASPQLRELAESVSGNLLKAGAKAGVTAASRRVEGMTERLEQRTDALRGAASHRDEEPEDEEPENEEPENEEEDEQTRKSSRSSDSGSGSRSRSGSRSSSKTGSDSSERSPAKRKESSSSTSKKSPSRSSTRPATKQTTQRKSRAKKTAASSSARKE